MSEWWFDRVGNWDHLHDENMLVLQTVKHEKKRKQSNIQQLIKVCTSQLLSKTLKSLLAWQKRELENLCRTSLKSAHSTSRCLMVSGQLHGMHSGGGSPFSKNSRVRRECPCILIMYGVK